jgi:anti-anti-sigma factor
MAQMPFANSELKLETVTTSEEALIRCIGKLTYTSSEVLRSAVHSVLPQTKHLVLDLKDMTYMDSYGLGVLVGIYVSAKRQDCQLTLINVSQQAKNVLRITNLTYLVE